VVANVKGVVNELRRSAPSAASQARSNDTYITSKVKARFIDANKFQANHVKVVTEAGTVFLLGLVTRKEADEAAEIARTTAGVKKVVRVFEYVEIREAQRLDNRPAEEAKPKPAEPK
jgi:osmotically-inducible protein OsmY